jgi:thiol:disulfide interchange protein DsbD
LFQKHVSLQLLGMPDHLNRFRTLAPGWIFFVSILLFIGLPKTALSADNAVPAVSNLFAPTGSEAPEPVKIQTAWSADGIRPGDSVILAVVFNIQDGFHINADAGQLLPMGGFKPVATRVTVTSAPMGLRLESVRYPKARAVTVSFAQGELMSFEGRAIAYLPMTLVTPAASPKIRIRLQVDYQACDDRICLFPQQVPIEIALPVLDQSKEPAIINRPLFDEYPPATETVVSGRVDFDLFGWQFSLAPGSWWGFAVMLLVAGLGGFLLNFTPCVLPLIPIKIMSLSNVSQDQSRCLALGLTMFLGVLGFWLALGTAIALVAEFTATNQLFQYPFFTISIGVIIALMALGMCGLFSLRLPSFVYNINPNQESLRGSFLLGILAAILSTPCTAPFMGAAAAWAATQHPLTTLATFVSIGFGMALPYLVLSACPRLVCRMPRTGPASVLIKQVMGLFMLAAAAYFIGTGVSGLLAQPPNPPSRFYWWAVMLLTGAAGSWLAVRALQIASKRLPRAIFAAVGLLLLAGSLFGGMRLTDEGPVDWVHYTPQRFEEAVGQQRIVVLVFTAEWCLNCKALEQGVLHSRKMAALLASDDVVPMKADITGNNVWGKEKLRELGHLTIPLLVIFSKSGQEIFRSDYYTAEQIQEAVNAARSAAGLDSLSTAG